MYKYGVLRIENSEVARQHNEALLGTNTLGIEVTRADLAAKCGLGNIDPQHQTIPTPDCSAIRSSLAYSLPPQGTKLVTIRPDADAFGAMAVLTARAEGRQHLLLLELVEAIHLIDCSGSSSAFAKNPEIAKFKLECSAIEMLVRTTSYSVEERVAKTIQILTGGMEEKEMMDIVSKLKQGDYNEFEETTIVPGKIVLITTRGQYGQARFYGTRRYPVTLICDHEYITPGIENYTPHKRWCVVKQEGVSMDMNRFKAEINKAESLARGLSVIDLEKRGLTWGGPKNLASSPQGTISVLPDTEIIEITIRCMG